MVILFALLGTALCVGMILFLERNEEGLKLIGSKKDLLVIAGSFFIVEATLFSFTGYGREFICHSLIFFYLITASYIDNRTQQVYRIGSIVFIAFCAALFLCKDMGWEIRFEKTVSLLIFNMAVIAFGKMDFMGWGDVLTFAGVSYWLGTFTDGILTLESCLYCMLFSSILFVAVNVKDMDWGNLRMKEYRAFVPSIAGGALITLAFIST